MEKVYFAKIRPDAVIPSKIKENAGYDLYACYDGDEFILHPFRPTLVPTGIAWASSPTYDFNLNNERGSVGTKGLLVLCGLVDSGFRNQIMVVMMNLTDKPIVIDKTTNEYIVGEDYDRYPASKAIAQGKIEIVPEVEVEEVSYADLLEMTSERGLGMLGSSGK